MQFEVRDELPAGRSVRQERVDWAGAKEAMLDHPTKWVLVARDISASTPSQLTQGKNVHFRGEELHHFEFRVRKPEDPALAATYGPRRSDLWGRYTP